MSEHTKEPWHVGDAFMVGELVGGNDVFPVYQGEAGEDDLLAFAFSTEDARRIVACVNACAGIPTELIEQGGFAAVPVATHREVKQQRDELLAALKESQEFMEYCWRDVQMSYYAFEKLETVMEQTRALIARMEEGK